jgi:hypothetical protein
MSGVNVVITVVVTARDFAAPQRSCESLPDAAIVSQRFRPEGIRMISLYPPDFDEDGLSRQRNRMRVISVSVSRPSS